MNSKILLYVQVSPDPDDQETVCIVHNNSSITIHANSADLINFYEQVITNSSVSKEINKKDGTLRRIVTSTYGVLVRDIARGDFDENTFDAEIDKLKNKKTFTIKN